jgi:hypothetical protein
MSSTRNITLLNVDHQAIARVDVHPTGELSLPSPPWYCSPGIAPRELFCPGHHTLCNSSGCRPVLPACWRQQNCCAVTPCPRPSPPPHTHTPLPTPPGSSRMFNWVDYDGSATQRSTPSIVGSWPSWWNLAPDCSYEVRSGCQLGVREGVGVGAH